ncbi:E3 ubiquitin-protein ligase SHPRH [Ananas comosus]|uniref:E3 ubiquitin-protein ligase SHPRH n=1 Tax=Ananas comosus TaxID=4615 RepID=A0A199VTX5_ANACO|nr:E3 ubiquitin-protein ligase SHPRH [Ananas comosus]
MCIGKTKGWVKAMRKEYSQARFLSIAQAQFLRAPDEIKMSTSRLRLKETEDEPSAINVLTREDLIPTSMQLSSDKFSSSSSMACIKGQLRYLKGLVLSNQKTKNQCINSFSKAQDNANFQTSSVSVEETANKIDDEPCPICQERYYEQKMMLSSNVRTGFRTFWKIEAVARRILWIISTEKEAKILVYPAGTMSLHGANGLNLLEAQYVILVEPLLNLAAEAQAINRIHRVGQGKKTFIHRFIVKDSIEKSI